MKKKRRIIIFILAAAVFTAVLIVCIARFLQMEQKKVTAEEWIVKKYELVEQFDSFSSGLDDVISLYSMGSISVEDLSNEIYVAKSTLALMKKLYDQDLEEHPIKIGTHTYETKKGMEGLELIWECYDSMLSQIDDVCRSTGSANDVAYVYLAYRETVAGGLFDYMQAYYSVTDPSKMLKAETSGQDNTETGKEEEYAG